MVPWASATPFTVRAMRSLISVRTVALWVRRVPSITTSPAMMLNRVPPRMRPMLRTRGWRPSIWRVTMSCRAWTISAAMGIGSRPMWGWAPWTVWPSTVMVKVSLEAKNGPGGEADLPGLLPATDVEAEDRLHLRVVEGALGHHERRPALLTLGRPFLGGLEEEDDGPGETVLEAGRGPRRHRGAWRCGRRARRRA